MKNTRNLRQSSRSIRLTRSVAGMLAAAGAFAPVAKAADLYWDGISSAWGTVANWSSASNATSPDPGAVPGAADTAIFNISTVNAAETVSLAAAHAALGLTFNNTGTTALVGSGGNRVLTLGTGGILVNAGAGAVTIGSGTANTNVSITLGGAQSWTNNASTLLTVVNGVTNGANLLTVNGTGNVTVGGIIGNGAGGITKSNTGTLTLSGVNTYTGATTLTGGILRATTSAAALGAGTLSLGGGTLQLANDTALAYGRNTTVTANTTITSDRLAAGAGLAHSLGTLSIGAQTLSVTRGANATSGTGQINFGATTMTGAATWDVQANALLLLGAVGETGGSRNITKIGAGILELNGASTYTGSTDVQNGTVRVSNAAGLGGSTAINLTAISGGTNFELRGGITLGSGKTLTMNTNTTGDLRSTFLNGANNNVWQGNVVFSGTGFAQINAATGTTLTISGNVTSTGGGSTGTMASRGAGTVIFTGNINLGTDRNFSHTDAGTVIVTSTGNTWKFTQASNGQIQVGANDALATGVDFALGQNTTGDGRFELNGFNQTVAGLRTTTGSTGAHIIRNSNLNSPSVLTITPTNTDTLFNTQIHGAAQGVGSLTLVKNGTGRSNFQDVRLDNAAIEVNAGTLGFTGTTTQFVVPTITGLAGAIIDKAGTGTVNLKSAYTHAGVTTISGGRLNFGSGTSGDITLAGGATLGAGFGGGTLTSGVLILGSTGTSTFAPILGAPNGTPLITASSLGTAGSSVAVTPSGANLVPGTYPLIAYGGGTIGGNGLPGFAMGAAGTYPHMQATITETPGASVNLSITSVDSLIWTGATGAWDINTTANFKLASDETPATFYQGDAVLFDDTGVTKAITVTGTPTIGRLTFNNSTGNDYTITGALTGPGGVTKNNTGTVTLATASTFTGPISVTNGLLVLGGANTGTGEISITGGTLRLGNANAVSASPLITVSNGGTIDTNTFSSTTPQQDLHISGAGVGGGGAVVNNGATGPGNLSVFSKVTFDGNVSWGGAQRNDMPASMRLFGNGFTLTKVGAGETWYQPNLQSEPGAFVVNGGTLGVQSNNPISAGVSVTVNTGAFHSVYSNVSVQHPVTLNDGGTLRSTNSAPVFNGTVTLSGSDANRFIGATTGTTLNVAGQITGTGGFTKSDVGTVQIRNSANNYLGNTTLAAGTLNFDALGILPTSTNLVFSGGTLDPSNRTHEFASISGTAGSINQATAGTGVVVSNQSTTTTYSGTVNRVTLRMAGTGSLTLNGATANANPVFEANAGTLVLAGTLDNSSGIATVNNGGTLVLAKTAADLAAHAVGSGLTINTGGTAQIGGSATALTGTGVNTPPVGAPTNYVDQIYNNIIVNLNTGGTLDMGGRSEAVQGIVGDGTVTNSVAATTSRLYFGSTGGTVSSSTFAGVIQDGAGQVAVEKLGATTLTLSGAHTYTGPTTLTTGTLNLTGSLGNTTVTTAVGTTLTGPGPIGGDVVLGGTYNGTGNIAGGVTVNGSFSGTGNIGGDVVVSGTYTGTGNITGALSGANGSTISLGGSTAGLSTNVISAGGLVFGPGATRSLVLDYTGTAVDRIDTTTVNGLTLDGTTNVTVNLGTAGWVTGNYPIFKYNTGVQGAGVSSLVLVGGSGHHTVSFVDDLAGNINLSVTAAAASVWKGNISNVWDNNGVANWVSADSKFLNGDAVLFDDTATSFTPTIATAVTTSGVTFDNSTNNYTLSGAAGIGGGGSLVKKGTGSVTLTNPNTYTGITQVQAGTLTANYNSGTATTVLNAASPVDIAGGATFRAIANDSDFTFANTVTGAGTITFDPHATADGASRNIAMNGNLAGFTGTMNLVPTTGTNGFRLAVDNANEVGGTTTVNISNGGQLFVAAGNLTFASNFNISGTGYNEGAGRLGAIRASNPTTLTGIITVNGTAKIGALGGVVNVTNTLTGGTLTFGGSNNASAETLNLTGDASGLTALVVNEGAATGNAANILFNVGNGTTTGTLGTIPVTVRGDGFKTGILRFDRTDGYTLGNTITGAGTLGRAVVDLDTTGAGFDSNGFNINLGTPAAGGVLRVGASRANATATLNGGTHGMGPLQVGVGAGATGAVLNILSGTTVNASQVDVALGATNATLNIDTGATVAVTGGMFLGQQATFGGVVNQAGGAVSVGQRLQIGHWPTETSTYNINGGTLTIANVASGASPSGTGEVNGGIYVGIDGTAIVNQTDGTVLTDWVVLDNRGDTAGTDQYNLSGGTLAVRMNHGIIRRNGTAQFNFSGGTILNAGSGVTSTINAPLNLSGTTATIDTNGATNAFTVIQGATGTGNLTKSSLGTLNLNANNSGWTGNLAVTGGTVTTNASGGLGSFIAPGRTISVTGGSTLSLGINNVFGDGIANNDQPAISLEGGSILTTTRYNSIGSLTLNGSTLTSAHGTNDTATYQSWQFRGPVTVGGTAASTVSGTGSFPGVHLNTNTVFTVANATASPAVDLVVNVPLLEPSADFGGIGGLTKDGPGTMELETGVTSPYTGPTLVTAGTLLVNGSLSGSAVTVPGGVLGGSGSVVGAVALTGGALAPGEGIGGFTTGSVSFSSTSTFAVELGGATPLTEYDQLTTGSINLNSDAGVGATLSLSLLNGYQATPYGSLHFIAVNDLADPVQGVFGNTTVFQGFNVVIESGQYFAVSYTGDSVGGTFEGGNDIVLMAVPEPGSALMLLAGLGTLVGLQRMRRRRH